MIPFRRIAAILLHYGNAGLSDADVRVRKVALSSLAQAANKAVQILVTIVSVPLMLGYLGAEQFGLAMAIVGFAQWYLFDTGIAEGVKVRLLESFAQNDQRASRAYVSTGMGALLLMTLVAASVSFAAFPLVNLGSVFNVSADHVNLHASAMVILLIMLPMIPLKILREIYTADQRGYVYSLWTLVGTVGSLAGIWLATRSRGGLAAVLAGMFLPVLLASVASCLYLFLKDMPWLKLSRSDVSMAAWRRMWPDSASLFFLGISLMVINGTDIFVVNYYLGGENASVYSLSLRIFLYVQVIVSFLTYPAWPAIGDAIQRNEWRWATKAAKTLFLLSFGLAVPLCGLLCAFGKPLIRAWSRGEVETGQTLLFWLAAYALLRIWCATFATILRALGRVHFQGIATLVEAILHLALGIYLLQRLGLVGLAIGSVASILLARAWALPCELYLAIQRKSPIKSSRTENDAGTIGGSSIPTIPTSGTESATDACAYSVQKPIVLVPRYEEQ